MQNIDIFPRPPWIFFAPLGIDFHTLVARGTYWGPRATEAAQIAELRAIAQQARPWAERKPGRIAMSSMSEYKERPERTRMKTVLGSHPLVDVLPRMNRATMWATIAQYQFFLSPPGMGVDCHRTWEVFAVGSVPIVLSSTLDEMYRSLQLPVLIVQHWEDVVAAVQNYDRSVQHAHPANWSRLSVLYWKNRILSEREEASALL